MAALRLSTAPTTDLVPRCAMDSTRDPNSMTAEERRDEVASIPGHGLVRSSRASRATPGREGDRGYRSRGRSASPKSRKSLRRRI